MDKSLKKLMELIMEVYPWRDSWKIPKEILYEVVEGNPGIEGCR